MRDNHHQAPLSSYPHRMERSASRPPIYPSLVHLHTRGTFYDVGYNVGLSFSQRIKLFFAESDNIQDKLLPFFNSRAGRDYYEESLRACQDCFPRYMREIRGMADGAGMPFEHVFMMNMSKEVYNVLCSRSKLAGGAKKQGPVSPSLEPDILLKEEAQSEKGKQEAQSSVDPENNPARVPRAGTPFQENSGCSDVFLNRPGCQFSVHNEDCDPLIKPYGYLLSADIQEDGEREQFTAFCYPGFLPGSAFSFNVHGLTISIDGLYPSYIVRETPGRLFVNRALLAARDVDDVIRLAKNAPYGMAYGFCANVSTKEGRMTSVEVGPGKPEAVMHAHDFTMQQDPDAPCHYYHFNSILNLKEVMEIPNLGSSTLRTQRSMALPPPRCLSDALTVMADTQDPLGPIFRTPRPTDLGETVCTAVFDVGSRQVMLYQGREDLLSNSPFIKMPMYQ